MQVKFFEEKTEAINEKGDSIKLVTSSLSRVLMSRCFHDSSHCHWSTWRWKTCTRAFCFRFCTVARLVRFLGVPIISLFNINISISVLDDLPLPATPQTLLTSPSVGNFETSFKTFWWRNATIFEWINGLSARKVLTSLPSR